MKIREFHAHMQPVQDGQATPPGESLTLGLQRLRTVEVSRLLERRRYSDTWNRWSMDHSPADGESSHSSRGCSAMTVPTPA